MILLDIGLCGEEMVDDKSLVFEDIVLIAVHNNTEELKQLTLSAQLRNPLNKLFDRRFLVQRT